MKKNRFAVLMCVGAYPMILGLLHFLPDALMRQPHWVKALVIVPTMITWMLYAVSPFIQRYFARWIGLSTQAGRD